MNWTSGLTRIIVDPVMSTNPNQEVDRKIREYISLRDETKTLKPKIDKLSEDLKAQQTPFKIHEVMMSSLTSQFGDIEAVTEKIETKMNFEMEVYKRLKGVVLSLTVDHENLQILETGSFVDSDDLVEIEKELAAVTEFSRGKMELEIMKEREAEVLDIISNFLKRFLTFISKMAVESEARGELRVHREFYKLIQRYKPIFKFSKTNTEYHLMICLAYMRKSKNLYESDFREYLNNLAELAKNVDGVKHATITLVRSYESLLECEKAFMKSMDIESDPAEIFAVVDSMIMDLLRLFFKKYPHYIMYALSVYCVEEYNAKLGSLGKLFTKELSSLESVFLSQVKNGEFSCDTVVLINGLHEISETHQLADKLIKEVLGRLQRDKMSVEIQLKRLQVVYGIKDLGEEDSDTVAEFKGMLVKKIIGKVFGAKNEIEEVKAVFSELMVDKPGYSEVSAFLKQTILENCDKPKQGSFIKAISDVTNKPK